MTLPYVRTYNTGEWGPEKRREMQQSEAGKIGGKSKFEGMTQRQWSRYCSKAGKRCLEEHGKEHFSEMGRKSARARVESMTDEDRYEFGQRMAEARRKAALARKRQALAEKTMARGKKSK